MSLKTVADLVAALSAMPQDKEVLIKDADTEWVLAVTMLEDRESAVIIGGEYYHHDNPQKKDGEPVYISEKLP